MGGYKVIVVSDIYKYDFDYIIIAIADYENEIKKQLLDIGIAEDKVVTFMPHSKQITWADERYAMANSCIQFIKQRNIKGNIAELGVYKGTFSAFLSRQMPDRKIYLFDTFEGFSEKDLQKNDMKGDRTVFKDTSVSKVLSVMPHKENVIIKKGWFPQSAFDVDDKFCFVSLDADLYEPILAGLEFFYPKLEKGGYIFVHDFQSINYQGCRTTVLEFCEKYNVGFVPILDRCASAVITK